MPTFQYEAMDNTGLEVKDVIDAATEQDAQAKIREKGFFVTKIVEKGKAKKTKGDKTKGDAKTQADANYAEVEADVSKRKRLSRDEEIELKTLWKKLVRLYHPDRFADQPDKIETYHQLTSAINQAREHGDIARLREIANDPHGFILRKGWSSLDFNDVAEVKNLRRLLDTLQIEIVTAMESLNDLHGSAEFELYELSARKPTLLEEVAAEQAKVIAAEIAELESQASQLQAEITELAGDSEERIA